MGKIMKKRLKLIIVLFAAFLLVSVAGISGTGPPVQVRTKTLTMTGMQQPAPVEEARNYQFTPVKIRTKTLTMTGTRN